MWQKPIISKLTLIGMTGCGKSTVGKKLAELTGYTFLDLDDMITEGEGKTPRELFDLYGEAHFRRLEGKYLKDAVTKEQSILSLGGGSILLPENRELLKRAETVWILRPFILVKESRDVFQRPPVNGDPDNYLKLFETRKRLYERCAGMAVENTDSTECALKIARSYRFEKSEQEGGQG